jgi:hypothetical protein
VLRALNDTRTTFCSVEFDTGELCVPLLRYTALPEPLRDQRAPSLCFRSVL